MCTVSFVPSGKQVIITSNRDEDMARAALTPEVVLAHGKSIWFPKDPRAGGSWFAASDQPCVVVLLNGAAERHEFHPPYRKSRGLVVLELVAAPHVVEEWKNIDLHEIEPFTLVVFQHRALHQLRWDGQFKTLEEMDANAPHIWSSTTLYPQDIRLAREGWFRNFLQQNPNPDAAALYRFHSGTHTEDQENGLLISRYGFLKTLSITQAVQSDQLQLQHFDLVAAQNFAQTFSRIDI